MFTYTRKRIKQPKQNQPSHQSKIINYYQYSTQPNYSQLDTLAQVLTQRYYKKNNKINRFNKFSNRFDNKQYTDRVDAIANVKKDQTIERIQQKIEDNKVKVVIYRNYFNFEGKNNQGHLNFISKNPLKREMLNRKIMGNGTIFSSLQHYREPKKQIINKKYSQTDYCKMLDQQATLSTYVTSQIKTKPKFKYLLKRTHKKISICNPQFQASIIRPKQTVENEQVIGKFLQNQKIKKLQNLYQGSNFKKNLSQMGKVNKTAENKAYKQQYKMLRPWSSHSSQQNF